MSTSIDLLHEIVDCLTRSGLDVWVFGGWAEELGGVITPREHRDIDLLLRAKDFGEVDRLLARHAKMSEITAKRFVHKRAFLYKGIMVELFLVQQDEKGWFTNFWGTVRFDWPLDAFVVDAVDALQVVDESVVAAYRQIYDTVRYEKFHSE